MKKYVFAMPELAPCRDRMMRTAHHWEVETPYGRLTVPANFKFDGASIPRFLWRLCGSPWDSPRVVAALLHDWLYRSHELDRAKSDGIYRDMQIALGIKSWKARLEYRMLRIFGGKAWKKEHEARTC